MKFRTGEIILKEAVKEKIDEARKFFGIESFPSNFFDLINRSENSIKDYGLLVFKEDIGKLSGFIGYGKNELAVICINYKRSIGHQNFTLAHEIGHWFLHRGESISDTDSSLYDNNKLEDEANQFAHELLYPNDLFTIDFNNIKKQGLLLTNKRKELAVEVDRLCHKYCISFKFVLRKILYRAGQIGRYKAINKEIELSLGSKISKYFDSAFYVVDETLPEYQINSKPYELLKAYIDKLLVERKIGLATAESILYKYGMLKS